MARITVFGLGMDQLSYARIMNAVRGEYPTETAGLSDPKAAQTVLKLWLVDIVARYERRVAADPNRAAADARDIAIEEQRQADMKARNEVGTDVQVTAT